MLYPKTYTTNMSRKLVFVPVFEGSVDALAVGMIFPVCHEWIFKAATGEPFKVSTLYPRLLASN